jgi:hypothetical protein
MDQTAEAKPASVRSPRVEQGQRRHEARLAMSGSWRKSQYHLRKHMDQEAPSSNVALPTHPLTRMVLTPDESDHGYGQGAREQTSPQYL